MRTVSGAFRHKLAQVLGEKDLKGNLPISVKPVAMATSPSPIPSPLPTPHTSTLSPAIPGLPGLTRFPNLRKKLGR